MVGNASNLERRVFLAQLNEAEKEELLSKKPELPGYLPVLEASKPRPLSPYYAEISGVMQLEIHSVITGLTTPEEGAANIIQKVGQILL